MNKDYLVKTIDKQTIKVKGELVKTSPKSKAPGWFQEFNKQLNHRLDGIDHRLSSVESDIKAIKNTPTMKKEQNKSHNKEHNKKPNKWNNKNQNKEQNKKQNKKPTNQNK